MNNKDSLGDRMKSYYESRSQTYLTRRTNTLIRLDGKAFHTFTRGCKRPYDLDLMSDMDKTAQYLCSSIQGCKFAYIQSDEISLLVTDYDSLQTGMWFEGNIQKIASISASLATSKFNELCQTRNYFCKKFANFDSRCFTIPTQTEVVNYFIWRQQDATRNSIQMVGQANFSHKQLQHKSCNEIQEMLWSQKGINWNDCPVGFKRGRICTANSILEPPIFTEDRDYILNFLPEYP